MTAESRVVTGVGTLATATAFDAASRVASITYPSGTVVAYTRNSMGRVTGVSAKAPGAGSFSSVVSSVLYQPFGPAYGFTWGNGITASHGWDFAYRATVFTDAATAGNVQGLTYGYYANDSIQYVTDAVNANNSQSFGFDAMDRLTGALGSGSGYGQYYWTWDANSNTASQQIAGVNSGFNYTSGTNQLANILTAGTVKYFNNDANGNYATEVQGGVTYDTQTYSAANRLASTNWAFGTAATYKYGFNGIRLEKAISGSYPVVYQYGVGGELLAENDLHSGQVADYITMDPGIDERPIGEINPHTGALYFTHTDAIGAVQKVTDASQNVVWSAMYKPFGDTLSFSGTLSTQSLRFPGQYFDSESGLTYNGFRYYAPGIARYIQPDPSGLGGGLNTYQYAFGNPRKYTDPFGLDPGSSPTVATTTVTETWNGPPQIVAAAITKTAAGDTIENEIDKILGDIVEGLEGTETALLLPLTLSGDTPNNDPQVYLYRAVDPTELAYLQANGNYGSSPNLSGKYFALTYSGVQNFMNTPFNQSYSLTLTSTSLPQSAISRYGYPFHDTGGAGPSIYFPEPTLLPVYKQMTPPQIHHK